MTTDQALGAKGRDIRLGIDVGGTFTDAVLWDGARDDLVLAKVPSTPGQFVNGVLAAAAETLAAAGLDGSQVTHVVHSSTVAANVVNEKKGAKVGLITTEGFRDVLEIQRVKRDVIYSLDYKKPAPLVPRELRLDVPERLDASGEVVVPLDEAAVRAAVRQLGDAGCTAIAVVFLFSFLNPAHERRVAEIIAEELPEVFISLSSTVNPEFREYERASTTVIDAYVKPEVTAYYLSLKERLAADLGFRGRLDIIQSAGGAMAVREAASRPSQTVESGAASGAIAAAYFARFSGVKNAVAFDMGGTTGKATLIQDGKLSTKNTLMLDRLPVRTSVIDLIEISGGGGTIAWVDDTGLLRLGPASSGATPGPACYGRGGTLPTMSDANALLGYYPDTILGGRMNLDIKASGEAVRSHISSRIGMNEEEVALGILRIANAAMEGAIRVVSTQRGVDLRDSVLIPFGGAGPVHACMLAQQLGIPRVLVPPAPGNVNAFGALVADTRYDFSAMFSRDLAEVDAIQLQRSLESLSEEGMRSLEDVGSSDLEAMTFTYFADLRYKGQGFELTVAVPWGNDGLNATWREDFADVFHEAHQASYKFSSPDAPIEIVSLRLVVSRAAVELRMHDHPVDPEASRVSVSTRMARFPGTAEKQPVDVYQRSLIPVDEILSGPAIVEEYSSTTVIPPGTSFFVDQHGNLDISIESENK